MRPGLAPASDPAFRKPLSVSPFTTQMTDGGAKRGAITGRHEAISSMQERSVFIRTSGT